MKKILLMLTMFSAVCALAQKPQVTLDLETSANAYFTENEFDQMAFKVNRLRFGVQGGLGDNLSYHFRTTYHKSSEPFSLDNMSGAIELAKLTWSPNEKLDFSAGKMFVQHAGYENYVNVILVREFTDFNSCIEVYQTGIQGTYHFNPLHQLTFQVTNNMAGTWGELYPSGLPAGVEPTKVPFMGTVNWDGYFADKTVRLMYSTSLSQVAKGKNMFYFMCGNVYENGPVFAYLDVLYTRAAVDKFQRITSLAGGMLPTAQNTEYLTLIADFEYQFTPYWNAYVKRSYETADVYKENGPYAKGHYLTTWNAQACLEWYPLTREKGLKVYLHYLYKTNKLHDRALAFNAGLPDIQRLSLGLTYSIPVL